MRQLGSKVINQKFNHGHRAERKRQKPEEDAGEGRSGGDGFRKALQRRTGRPPPTPLVWDSPVLARGTETKGETERKAAGAHLAVLCVDVLAVPLHYRPVDEQAPHDDDHFQHLPQGHLSKHMHVNVDAQTRESHAGHETLKGDALGALCGKAGGCPVGWHPECLGAKSRQAALP